MTLSALDQTEQHCVKEFSLRGCSCDFSSSKSSCCRLFSADHYESLRTSFAEMSHDELDLFIMGQVMAHTFVSSTVLSHSRKSTYGHFFHQGQRVCQTTFLFLHNIGIKRFKNIKAHLLENGPVVRVHGNKCRRPKRHLTFIQIKHIVQYILNYTGKKHTDK